MQLKPVRALKRCSYKLTNKGLAMQLKPVRALKHSKNAAFVTADTMQLKPVRALKPESFLTKIFERPDATQAREGIETMVYWI